MTINQYIDSKYYPSFNLFCIQYTDNSSEIITANTTNIPFKTKVIDTDNLWTGNSFITKYSTSYAINGCSYFVGWGGQLITLCIDGVAVTGGNDYIAGGANSFNFQRYIEAGKVVSIRVTVGGQLVTGNPPYHNINISAYYNTGVV